MAGVWDIVYNILLIASSTYGLTRKSLISKKFAYLGLALFCLNGCLTLVNDLTNCQAVDEAAFLAHGFANTIGVDLFAVDTCISSGVDPYLSCVILVPPVIDLIVIYGFRATSWSRVTSVSHILSVALLFNIAIRDGRPILIVTGMSFLFAVLINREDIYFEYNDVTGYNAIAVFCASWFFQGKDFKDMGF
ncbi:hypothetical protein GE061_009887 [Apolygus lucorum]|uniref:Uncharacterized protein n=1 Tax=Apolygus lucorum TaxID=248454 RepID=A0A6A4JU51_APOLU|nr:hypothetical protein GE061_009887 [Apolygus lucorum]